MMPTISDIANLSELPQAIQDEIHDTASLDFQSLHCVQDIIGRDASGRAVFCMAGGFRMFWPGGRKVELFEVTSYGSEKYQWSWTKE